MIEELCFKDINFTIWLKNRLNITLNEAIEKIHSGIDKYYIDEYKRCIKDLLRYNLENCMGEFNSFKIFMNGKEIKSVKFKNKKQCIEKIMNEVEIILKDKVYNLWFDINDIDYSLEENVKVVGLTNKKDNITFEIRYIEDEEISKKKMRKFIETEVDKIINSKTPYYSDLKTRIREIKLQISNNFINTSLDNFGERDYKIDKIVNIMRKIYPKYFENMDIEEIIDEKKFKEKVIEIFSNEIGNYDWNKIKEIIDKNKEEIIEDVLETYYSIINSDEKRLQFTHTAGITNFIRSHEFVIRNLIKYYIFYWYVYDEILNEFIWDVLFGSINMENPHLYDDVRDIAMNVFY